MANLWPAAYRNYGGDKGGGFVRDASSGGGGGGGGSTVLVETGGGVGDILRSQHIFKHLSLLSASALL